MNIDEMEAGRELDALVAERVMGWKFIPLPKRNRSGLCINCGRAVWDDPRNRQTELGICNEEDCRYSTDIAAAWQVVEKMEEQGYNFWMNSVIPSSDPIVYRVKFSPIVRDYVTEFTAPLAICRAALKAIKE